jgi:hypothetical protein
MCVCLSLSAVCMCVWVMATMIAVRCWQARATKQEDHGHEGREAKQAL